MLAALLVGACVLGAGPEQAKGSDASVLATYRAASSQAGSDADAHVRLALWCEAQGLNAKRLEHLGLAVRRDPGNARARALLGLVGYQGQWLAPEQMADALAADATQASKRAAYKAKRKQEEKHLVAVRFTSRKRAAAAHVKLGLWCEQNGLKDEATAHFTSAAVLDPHRDATWKHLGYLRVDGRWMSHEQAAAARAESVLQKRADSQWMRQLSQWKRELREEHRKAEAQNRLAEITDPRAVASIVRTFCTENVGDQRVAIQLLGQISTAESTRELAMLATLTASEELRAQAAAILRTRSKRDFVGMLVEQIHDPWAYHVVAPVQGPGSQGALEIEAPRFRALRQYKAPAIARLDDGFYGYVGYDGNGLPVIARGAELSRMKREYTAGAMMDLAMIEERTARYIRQAQLKAIDSQQRLIADIQAIERYNARCEQLNPVIITVLQQAAGAPASKSLGAPAAVQEFVEPSPAAALAEQTQPSESQPTMALEDRWKAWWYDQLGYSYSPPRQVTLVVNASPHYPAPSILSCFAAGTLVHTLEGPRPIETLHVGDQVLSQDVETGALCFRTINVVHHNPAGQILQVRLESGETLPASIYHRFWLAGQGWVQARHLKPGDTLRSLAGRTRVVSIDRGAVEPLFNLDVAGSHTFFVGSHEVLVHDNTLPPETCKPFDLVPSLAAKTP